jgi:hypothetical protein
LLRKGGELGLDSQPIMAIRIEVEIHLGPTTRPLNFFRRATTPSHCSCTSQEHRVWNICIVLFWAVFAEMIGSIRFQVPIDASVDQTDARNQVKETFQIRWSGQNVTPASVVSHSDGNLSQPPFSL